MPEPTLRKARGDDAATILEMIRELAEYEKMSADVRTTEEDILREGFGPDPSFECLLAEEDGHAVGFALFFRTFSTFEGRPTLYLEDIFVRPPARGRGIGRRLVAALAAEAVGRGWSRLDLAALHWNPARGFYEKLGFGELSEWRPYRLEGEALRRLAERATGPITSGRG